MIVTGRAGKGVPAAFAVEGDVVDEGEVFLHRPWPPPQLLRPHFFFLPVVALEAAPLADDVHFFCFLLLGRFQTQRERERDEGRERNWVKERD